MAIRLIGIELQKMNGRKTRNNEVIYFERFDNPNPNGFNLSEVSKNDASLKLNFILDELNNKY